MIKKIIRKDAIRLYEALGVINLGNLSEDTLEAIMANYGAFGGVFEDVKNLRRALSERLYKGITEEERMSFFEICAKYESEYDVAEKARLYDKMRAYADIIGLYEKHIAVLGSILSKEVEINIEEVDADSFIKGILIGHKGLNIGEVRKMFAPLFKEERRDTDLSELEELLK